jgi:hypothetical protein
MRDARLITRVNRLTEGDVTVVLEPLELIKIIDRYEHRCGLPVLREHDAFMAAPGTVDQFSEMTAGLRNRTRECHSSTVQLDATVAGTARPHADSHDDHPRLQLPDRRSRPAEASDPPPRC